MRQAGLRYEGIAPAERWDEARVLTEIQKRAKGGKSLRQVQVRRPLRNAAYRYFGAWATAVKKAGFDPPRALPPAA